MEIIKFIYIVLLAFSLFGVFLIGKDRGVYTPGFVFSSIVLNYGLIYVLLNL